MSVPIPVDISDSDSPPHSHVIETPSPKRQRTQQNPSSVFLIDDDYPTPRQQTGPASSAPEDTPMSDSDVAIVKCVTRFSDPQLKSDSGVRGLIFLESDDESGKGSEAEVLMPSEKSDFVLNNGKYPKLQSEKSDIVCDLENDIALSPRLVGSSFSLGKHNIEQTSGSSLLLLSSEDGMTQVNDLSTEENDGWERNNVEKRTKSKATINKDKDGGGNRRKKPTEEEKLRLKEEKKQQKEEEKLQKEAMKAEAAELKKLQKEKQKWEKGKFAQKSIIAEVDTKIIELGSVAGPLLTKFAEKDFTYRTTKNPIARSIVWNMTVPEELSQLMSDRTEVSYVLLVFEAEEFCNLVLNESLMDHVSSVQSHYPSHTICYLINRLMSYINRREQIQYKNPEKSSGWRRPPVEEVLAQLTTHFVRVHSRLCVDENELAEHVVGLTSSLASCLYRKRLTRLSVNANGSLVPKDCVDKNLIKKNTWLKALVAIPKVQPRFAIAIWKKYPTMKSLLSVYMDPNKSVHEKEFLLKDLKTEVMLGDDRRLGEVCSKRVYRILMAQCGTIKTDEVEDGADFFHSDILNNDESYFADDLGSCDRRHSKAGRGRGTRGK